MLSTCVCYYDVAVRGVHSKLIIYSRSTNTYQQNTLYIHRHPLPFPILHKTIIVNTKHVDVATMLLVVLTLSSSCNGCE